MTDEPGTSYTPGPWHAERAVDKAGFETGKIWIIMRCEPKAYDFDRFEDAQLASAAPDLLEALKELLVCAETAETKMLVGDEGCLWPVESARAAISKAVGR